MSNDNTIRTFDIPAYAAPAARAALDKMMAKAAKWGGDAGYDMTGEYCVREKQRDGFHTGWRVNHYVDVTVWGDAPTYGPFEFLASIERTPAGNLVDTVPGVEIDPSYQHTTGHCDHCGKARARKHVFVVRNTDTGETMQVGRTCLRDALGIDDPAKIAGRFRWLRTVRDLEPSGLYSAGDYSYSLADILAATATAIRLFGWASRGMAYSDPSIKPTSEYVSLVLNPAPSGQRDYFVEQRKLRQRIIDAHTDADAELAERARVWAQTQTGGSDYEHNLRVLASNDRVDPKRLGIVASAIQAYARAEDREINRQERARRYAQSVAVCEVGERIRNRAMTIELQRVIGSTQWGDTILVKFRDADGNLFSWFASRGTGFEQGEQVTVTGTVKAHREFRGVMETQLTRCKCEGLAKAA